MKDKIIAELLANYLKEEHQLISPRSLSELSLDDIELLNGFHMTEILSFELNDEYFLGMRANHFCVEIGYNEHIEGATQVLISANHKGVRLISLFNVYEF